MAWTEKEDDDDMEDLNEWGSRSDGPMTSDEYVHMCDLSPPGLCPFCRSNGTASIEGPSPSEDYEEGTDMFACSSCKKKWFDKYDDGGMAGYGEIPQESPILK